MKRQCIVFTILFSIIGNMAFFCFADDELSKDAKDAWNSIKKVGNYAGSFVDGMKEAFGSVPDEYKYSFRAWNDSPQDVVAASQKITGIMGANFTGDITQILALQPYQNSGKAFFNHRLRKGIWLCRTSDKIQKYAKSVEEGAKWGAVAGSVLAAPLGPGAFLGTGIGAALGSLIGGEIAYFTLKKVSIIHRDITDLVIKNDPAVYHYRAYTDRGALKGEYLGPKSATTAFNGVFINSLARDITMTFSKDDFEYKVTLEQNSFSILQSTSGIDYSIRPRTGDVRGFLFSDAGTSIGYMPLSPEGIANVSYDKDTNTFVTTSPVLYTYEIFSANGIAEIGMQGVGMGHFTQATKADGTLDRIRDINPIRAEIWYMSAEQAQEELEKENQQGEEPAVFPFNPPEQVWASYVSDDYTMYTNLQTGSVTHFKCIRPKLSEAVKWLYITVLKTNDDTKSKAFLDRLHSGIIGQDAISTHVNETDIKNLLQDILFTPSINQNGYIDDTKDSGVIGTILLADPFLSFGLGDGPFYYRISPPQLQIEQLISMIPLKSSLYQKDKGGELQLQTEVKNTLITNIVNWIMRYAAESDVVSKEIISYVMQYGDDTLFQDAKATKKLLTTAGNKLIMAFISGPISIKNYPVVYQAGRSEYVYNFNKQPDDWITK